MAVTVTHTRPDILISDEAASCIPLIREIWCSTNSHALGLDYQGPIIDLMHVQFSAKLTQYRAHYTKLQQRLAYVEDQPCGYVMWSDGADSLIVVDIAVLPTQQKKGIATSMLEFCFDIARQGNRPLQLTVSKGNPAISLYHKLGFRVTSSDAVYQQMRREPA